MLAPLFLTLTCREALANCGNFLWTRGAFLPLEPSALKARGVPLARNLMKTARDGIVIPR